MHNLFWLSYMNLFPYNNLYSLFLFLEYKDYDKIIS